MTNRINDGKAKCRAHGRTAARMRAAPTGEVALTDDCGPIAGRLRTARTYEIALSLAPASLVLSVVGLSFKLLNKFFVFGSP